MSGYAGLWAGGWWPPNIWERTLLHHTRNLCVCVWGGGGGGVTVAGDSVCSLELELVEGSVCVFFFLFLFGLNIYRDKIRYNGSSLIRRSISLQLISDELIQFWGEKHTSVRVLSREFLFFYHSNSSRILGGIGFCLSDVSFARQMAGRNWPDQVRTSEWRTDFHDLDEPVFLVQTRTEKWGLKKERKKICQLVLHLTPAAWKCGTLLAVTTKTLNYGSSGRIINHT